MEYPEKLTMEYLIQLVKEEEEIIRNETATEEDLKELNMSREEFDKSTVSLLNRSLDEKVRSIIYDIAHERITAVNKYDDYTLQRYKYPDDLDTEVINIKREVGYYEYFGY